MFQPLEVIFRLIKYESYKVRLKMTSRLKRVAFLIVHNLISHLIVVV